MKYVLEVRAPQQPDEVVATFGGSEPFLPVERGDLLNPAHWKTPDLEGKLLRVLNVEHLIGGEELEHRIVLFTEQLEGAEDARLERGGAAGTVMRMRRAAHKLADDRVADLREKSASRVAEFRGKGSAILESQLPRIQALIKEKVRPLASETIQNDEALTPILQRVYEFLPTTVRLVVKQEGFVAFCLRNRAWLVERSENAELVAGPDDGEDPEAR